MLRLTSLALSIFAVFLACSQATAHYLWIAVDSSRAGNQFANIFFEESPAPGDGHYLDHFLGTSDTWIRTLEDPNPKPVKAVEVKREADRWMQVTMRDFTEYSVDAYGKFGVYQYGKTNVLLHYYARNLKVTSHDAIHELGRAEQLQLDLVPHDVGAQIELTLLWKGEAVPDRMVFIRGPNGLRKNVTTNDRGRILLSPQDTGSYTFRSSVEEPTPGEEGGESYELVRHNITLMMHLPLSDKTD
jgi:hypothetical protein